MNQSFLLVVSAILMLLLSGCFKSEKKTGDQASFASTSTTPTPQIILNKNGEVESVITQSPEELIVSETPERGSDGNLAQNQEPGEGEGEGETEEETETEEEQEEQEPPVQAAYEDIVKVVENELFQYPELTLVLSVQDVQHTLEILNNQEGAKVVYDPNLGKATHIPYLIVNLNSDLLKDQAFISSLRLTGMSVDHPNVRAIRPMATDLGSSELENIFVPTSDIGVDKLRNRSRGGARGKGAVIAVIDTGVDASHPVFQDRVIFWGDETQEGRIPVAPARVQGGNLVLEDGLVALPASLQELSNLHAGKISEEALGAQMSDADKENGLIGLDFNNDGNLDDNYLLVAGMKDGNWVAAVDTNTDGEISEEEAQNLIMDFNQARHERRTGSGQTTTISDSPAPLGHYSDMVAFGNAVRQVSFPLLFEKDSEGKLTHLTLGADFNNHGTHVAGIAAANGENVIGAAPEAEIMSLKVCSGLTCTEAAILRALIKTFYNDQGIVPDIVNISLGSPEGYQQDIFNIVMRDLAAKFGTTFFISASNSGPGYRSLNSIGSFGPVIQVAAHVSSETLRAHYTVHPGVEVPEQSLLGFSSVGPSFTGQLRPNIAAPGSALSSTALIGGRLQMMNGTSMSSPIAAGAATALIGLAKTDSLLKPVFDKIAEKRARVAAGELGLGSLAGVPLALRTALEDSSSRMLRNDGTKMYTLAHEGHGLMDVNEAYDLFVDHANKWASGDLRFIDLKINSNSAALRLYDRGTSLARVKNVTLNLEDDYELTDADIIRLSEKPLLVKLESVDVESSFGVVETLSGENLPFSIQCEGLEGQRCHESEIVLAGGIKNGFSSIRYLDEMEEGKNYVAHYGIYEVSGEGSEQRIFSIADVVHKPYVFKDVEEEYYLPGIEATRFKKRLAVAVEGKEIPANGIHRYALAVNENTTRLILKTGFFPLREGRLFMTVYDPDGLKAGSEWINRAEQHALEKPSTSLIVDTLGKPGIYEVTIGITSGRWMGATQYDFIAEALQFKPSVSKIVMGTTLPALKTVVVSNPMGQITTVGAALELSRMERLSAIPVQPNRWTFKRLRLPQSETSFATNVSIDLSQAMIDKEVDQNFVGRIDHRIYEMNEEGKFEVVYTSSPSPALAVSGGDFEKVFPGVQLHGSNDRKLFIAIETFASIPESAGVGGIINDIELDVLVPGLSLDRPNLPTVTKHPDSTAENVLFVTEMVNSLEGIIKDETPRPVVKGSLKISTEIEGLTFDIPVEIHQ